MDRIDSLRGSISLLQRPPTNLFFRANLSAKTPREEPPHRFFPAECEFYTDIGSSPSPMGIRVSIGSPPFPDTVAPSAPFPKVPPGRTILRCWRPSSVSITLPEQPKEDKKSLAAAFCDLTLYVGGSLDSSSASCMLSELKGLADDS